MEAIDHYEMTFQRVLYGWVIFSVPLVFLSQLNRYHTTAKEHKMLLRLFSIMFMSISLLFLFQRANKYFSIDHPPQPIPKTMPRGMNINVTQTANSGMVPLKGDIVRVHYTGTLLDGTKFDSSLDRNTMFEFQVGMGRVIKCWDEGFQRLQVGDTAILTCPPDVAYGNRAMGGVIPANSTLIFHVTLHELDKKSEGESEDVRYQIKLLTWQKDRHKYERDMYLSTCAILSCLLLILTTHWMDKYYTYIDYKSEERMQEKNQRKTK